MATKTFFSYSRVDTEFTRKLATDLRNAGADLWIDQLDIQPGTRWDMEIEKALKEAETVIVVLSPNAVASNNIMDEISYALENNKKVIPVIIEHCEVPFRIKRLQYIDFAQNYDEGFNRLSSVLNLNKPNLQTSVSENKTIPEKIIQTKSVEKQPGLPKNISSQIHASEEKKVLPHKKPFSKWIYFGAGAAALLVILILIFTSGGSSGNHDADNNDSVNLSTGNISNDAITDSLQADSLFKLGTTEQNQKNYDKAIELYEKSAELGNSEAMAKLGDLYEGNLSASLADFEKTLYWRRRGANANNLDAMYSYGMLLNGNTISNYYKVPPEMINKDSSMYYWNFVNENTPGGVVGYKKAD